MFCIITLQNPALMRFPHLLFFLECVLNRSHASLLEEVYDNYTSFKQFYNSYIVCLIFDLSSSLDLSNGNQISTNFQVPGSWRYVISLLIVDWILSFQLLKKQPHERLGGGPDDSKPIKVWWNQGQKNRATKSHSSSKLCKYCDIQILDLHLNGFFAFSFPATCLF